MSSGNPYGLAEISHFGSFQHVGGKAGGFINKKFFHPSSINNQEKLWKAMDADAKLEREQNELQKRRNEERQVEDLKKQMYLAGQGKACDVASNVNEEAKDELSVDDKSEQLKAHEEFKKRRAALRQERASRQHADGDEPVDDVASRVAARPLAKSTLYREDEHVLGHSQVWGSWYTAAEEGRTNGRWGFACCKVLSRGAECPVAQAEEEVAKREAEAAEAKDGPRAAKRKRKAEAEADTAESSVAASSSSSAADPLVCGAAERSVEPLVDTRMLEAAERRKEKKRREDEAKEKETNKTSDYLADLLGDPTAGI